MILASAVFLCCLVSLAPGISVSQSVRNGGGSVSSSTIYNLDPTTELQEQTVLGESVIVQSRNAAGSGRNCIDQTISGNGYQVNNIIESTGSFSASSTASASENGIGLSQNLKGSGDLSAVLGGSNAFGSSSQVAEVALGALDTSQSLAASNGIYVDQSTKMTGEAGGIIASSSSPGNKIEVAGDFSGEGNLLADLSAASDKRSTVRGDASFLGIPVLDDENMNIADSGDVAMSVDGLYSTSSGNMGEFRLTTANRENDGTGNVFGMYSSPLLTGPTLTPTGGRSTAYCLLGYRWNTKDPQLKWVLKNDAYMTGEGLSASNVKSAIEAASNTWDAGTNQNLFADTNLVTLSPTVNADTYDGKNTVAWNPFGAGALAYARTWYRGTKVGGYYSALESEINMNTAYSWSTTGSGSKIDVQSVILHEMGHSIGLGDLYGKAQFASDKRQVMHYYTGVKRTLGNGDATGVWTLYK